MRRILVCGTAMLALSACDLPDPPAHPQQAKAAVSVGSRIPGAAVSASVGSANDPHQLGQQMVPNNPAVGGMGASGGK